jgi:hypothetical protein
MKKMFLLFIVANCIYSCKPGVKKLGANPKVSYYIVGRLRTMEVNSEIPFEVKVRGLDPKLIEKPFVLKIENAEQFSLSYLINDKEETKTYSFGEEIKNADVNLVILKTSLLNSINCENIKNIDYQFQVKGEEN